MRAERQLDTLRKSPWRILIRVHTHIHTHTHTTWHQGLCTSASQPLTILDISKQKIILELANCFKIINLQSYVFLVAESNSLILHHFKNSADVLFF